MNELESSLHLAQPPLYGTPAGRWFSSFIDAVKDCGEQLTWDPAAILSILSFNYACGDRTLVNEVKRRPWLSHIGPDGQAHLEKIPSHGRLWKDDDEIADNFIGLLCDEAADVCSGYREIYVLLSGGLDSRVVAGILAKILKEGRLNTKPKSITWGLEDCRDVAYGREIARILGFDWRHIELGPEDVMNNINEVIAIGNLVPPLHLHPMPWFKNVSKDALVIAASYGDSIGRAEFSGNHLLELDYLRPVNRLGLIRPEVYHQAVKDLQQDLKALHNRTPDEPKYVLCEHEMQGHYMRGMIAHVMSIINEYCYVYQMFTDPRVYSYMWSVHPALRTNEIYAGTLEKLNPQLAKLPWARTNRALKGKTIGAKSSLRKEFHQYPAWIEGELFDELCEYIEPQWFAETGIFDYNKVKNLARQVHSGQNGKGLYGFTPYEKWIWLAGFRRLVECLQDLGKSVKLESEPISKSEQGLLPTGEKKPNFVRMFLSRSASLYNLTRYCSRPFRKMQKKIRRSLLNYQTIRKYPPRKNARTA